jgi:CubicO group peptidase (beta-lactamase class C family)
MSEKTMPSGGVAAAGYEGVRAAFLAAQAGDPGGAQLCVYRRGEKVVDLWAGWDPANERPYGEDGVGVLMSCTKGVVVAGVHILADRGLIDFDAPMATYWPEFAEGGKARITVAQCLSHAGGLMGYDAEAGMGPAEQFDFDRSVREVAKMTPLWAPGTATMYHFITFGVLAGELIRRVDGRSPGRFIADEIVRPLGIDLWIGLPAAQEARRVPHFRIGPELGLDQWRAILAAAGADLNDRLIRAFLATVVAADGAIAMMNTSRASRTAELPAGNAIGDARALARVYAALIGPVDGVRLIGAAAMERARAPRTGGLGPPGEFAKLARGEWQPFGLGYELPAAVKPMLGPGSFGHAGAGGRWAFAHPETGVAVGYACNTMIESAPNPDPRWVGWLGALREAVGA